MSSSAAARIKTKFQKNGQESKKKKTAAKPTPATMPKTAAKPKTEAKAHIRTPDPTERHADAWLRCLKMALSEKAEGSPYTLADKFFAEYRKRFP